MASRYDDKRHHRRKRKKGSGFVSFLTTLLLLIAIGVFSFSAYKLYGYWKDYKAGENEYQNLADTYTTIGNGDASPEGTQETEAPGEVLTSVEDLENPDGEVVQTKVDAAAKEDTVENGETKQLPVLVNPINFEELNAINDEIIGWVRIGALEVSYPIAQAADNDFFLHRTFEKQYNFAGCIFLNCTNSKYFTDQNSIVYGHNMKNGSMFGTLKNFRNQELYDSNPYFWIFTPTLIYQYRIFSAREIALSADAGVYQIRYTLDSFQSFLDMAVSQSVVDSHGLTVTTEDRVTTLSTCTGNSSTRFVVQGVLEQIYISE